MTDSERLKYITDVMEVLHENDFGDLNDSVWPYVRDGVLNFSVNCNDLFYWATGDGQELTPENLPRLVQAVDDVRAAYGVPDRGGKYNGAQFDYWWNAGHQGAMLFCCRERKMRPQEPVLKDLDDVMRPLIEAAGPWRDPKDGG